MKLKYTILTLLSVLLALGMAGCLPGTDADKPSSSEPSSQEAQLPEPPAEFPVEVGGTVVASRPGKVVSLSPAITEKIFDLGLTNRLAGVSNFCADFIPDAAGSEKCGTAQQPDLDVILGLGAHLVVSEIPLPEEDQEALRDKEIDVVVIPHAQSLEELWDAYIALCRMFEGEHAGQQMGDEFVAAVSG